MKDELNQISDELLQKKFITYQNFIEYYNKVNDLISYSDDERIMLAGMLLQAQVLVTTEGEENNLNIIREKLTSIVDKENNKRR